MREAITSADSNHLSVRRLYILRALYLLNFGLIGAGIFPQLVRAQPAPLMEGVALSFYAALATLSLLGLRYPAKMIPVLFLQLGHKLIWLLAVIGPLWIAEDVPLALAGAVPPMLVGAALDIVAIPWPYVATRYVRAPSEPWRMGPPGDSASVPPN